MNKREYICPMHPQVRKPSPGSCPICGMDLEPHLFEENSELKHYTP